MSWQEIVNTVAPTIATALGGPLAGMATNKILSALGLKPDCNDDDILLSMQNPENLLKIKELEKQFKVEMRKLDIEVEKLHASDRDSARKREAVVKDRTPAVLSFLITTGFFGAIYVVMTGIMPPDIDKIIAGSLLGTLGTAWIAVVSYYFGSSVGSKNKDQIIRNK
jgi:hypothetical protein